MKKVILHGEIGEKFGTECNLAINSPSEAIRALQANNPEFEAFLISQSLQDKEYTFRSENGLIEDFDLQSSDDTYHIIPAMKGSGGALGILGNIGMGIFTSLLSGWIMKKLFPNKNKDDDQARINSNSYLYNGAENVEKQGVPIPIGYGRLRVGSKIISNALLNLDFDYDNGKVASDPFDFYKNQNLLQSSIREGKEDYKRYILTSSESEFNSNNELTGSGIMLETDPQGNPKIKDLKKIPEGQNNVYNIGGGTINNSEAEYNPGSVDATAFPSVYSGRITLSTLKNLNEIEESGDGDENDFVCYQTILSDEYFNASSELEFQDRYNYLGLLKRFLPVGKEEVLNQIKLPLNFNYDEEGNSYNPITRGVRKQFSKLESIGFYKTIDLICEGPIEGFVDQFGNSQQFLDSENINLPQYKRPIFQDISEVLNTETGSFDLSDSLTIEDAGSPYTNGIPNIVFSHNGNLEQASIILSDIDETYQGKFDSSTNSLTNTGTAITPKTKGLGYSDSFTYLENSDPIKAPCEITGIQVVADVNYSNIIYEGFGIYNLSVDEWSVEPSIKLREEPNFGASYFSGDKLNEQTLIENLIFYDPDPAEVKASVKLIRENLDENFHSQLNAVNANPLEDYGSSGEEDSDFLNAYQIAAISGEEGDVFTININNDEITVTWDVGDSISVIANKISQEINTLYEDILLSVVNEDNKILILQQESGYAIPPYITVSVDNINSTIKIFDLRSDIYGEAFLNASKYGAGYKFNTQSNYKIWIIGTDLNGEEKRCYFEVETKTYNDDLLEKTYKGLSNVNDKPVIVGGLQGNNKNFDHTKEIIAYAEPAKTAFNVINQEIVSTLSKELSELRNLGFNSFNETVGATYPELRIDYENQENTGIRGVISGQTSAIGIAEVSKGRITSFYIDTENEDEETYCRYYPGETVVITLPYPGSNGGDYIKIDRDRNTETINLDEDIINDELFENNIEKAVFKANCKNGQIEDVSVLSSGSNYSESDEYLFLQRNNYYEFSDLFNGILINVSYPMFVNPTFEVVLDEDNKVSEINILTKGEGFNDNFKYFLKLDNPPSVDIQNSEELPNEEKGWDNFLKGVYFNGIPVKNTVDSTDENGNNQGIYNFSLNFDIDVGKKQKNMILPSGNITKNLIGSEDQDPLDFAYHHNFKTVNIDAQLFGPRKENETVIESDNAFEYDFNPEDYYVTHTIENLLVETIYASLEIKELYYVYEGDKEKVTINLGPIIAALIAFLVLGSIAVDKVKSYVLNALSPPPAPPTFFARLAADSAGAATWFAAAWATFNEEIIGLASGLIDKVFDDILGWDNFLKFTMGEKIENSGEIWPTDIKFKIEVSNEGLDKKITIVNFNSIATSSYVKDIRIDLPANHNNLKRIVKVSRLTRESDPVVGGEEEARHHKTAFLKSITEVTPSVLSYPNSVIIGSRINSKDMPSIPKREFDLKLKLLALPSNYDPETREYTGIWDGLLWGQEESNDEIEERYLRWSDNPAWCIYDLLTNARYGIGKYGLNHTNVDKWSLYEIGKYCDELVYSGITPKYQFRSFSYSQEGEDYILIFDDLSEDIFYEEFKDGVEIKGKTIAMLGYLNSESSRRKIIRKIRKTDKSTRKVYITKPLPQDELNEVGQVLELCANDKIIEIGSSVGEQRFATVEYGYPIFEPRFSMNILIQDRQKALPLIQNMVSFFNTVMYYDGGKVIFDQDKEKTPVLDFTNSDVSKNGFTYSTTRQSERPTVVIARYNDATDDFQQKMEYIEDAEAISKFGYIEQEIDPLGITSRGQARRAGRYMLDTFQKETEVVEFETFSKGQYLKPGSLFRVIDNNRLPQKFGGRVMGVNIVDKSIDVEFPFDVEIDPLDEDTHLKVSLINPKDSTSLFDINKNPSEQEIDFQTPQIENFIIYKTSKNKETLYLRPEKTLTDVEFENQLKKVPLGSSWNVDAEYNNISTAVTYKAITVNEKGKSSYEIQGLQYDKTKFSNLEDEKLELLLKNKGFEDREISINIMENIQTDFKK